MNAAARAVVFLLLVTLGISVFGASCVEIEQKGTVSVIRTCVDYYNPYFSGIGCFTKDPCSELDQEIFYGYQDMAVDYCSNLVGEDYYIYRVCANNIQVRCPTVNIFYNWFFNEYSECSSSGSGEALSFADWLNEHPDYDGQWPDYPECFEDCINGVPPWEHPELYQ